MNCAAVRKYIYAFADGELDVHANCDVLDHLKMCPTCGQLATEQQALRHAIARQIHSAPVPAALRARLSEQLRGERIPAKKRSGDRVSILRRIGIPLAAAAALFLAALSIKQYFWQPHDEQPPIPVLPNTTAASRVAELHEAAIARGPENQSKDLPASLADLKPTLKDHFQDKLAAITPDLASRGFDFESANYCKVSNRLESDGVQLLYASRDKSKRLSLFSLPRWDVLDRCRQQGIPNNEDIRWYEVERENGGKLSIIAWHDGNTTYACCAPVPSDELKTIVADIRAQVTASGDSSLHRGD